MADLDTRQKRESSIGISLSFLRVLPTPDGSDADSEDERAHLAFMYNGVPTAAAGPLFNYFSSRRSSAKWHRSSNNP